jgi:hypothetical protein
MKETDLKEIKYRKEEDTLARTASPQSPISEGKEDGEDDESKVRILTDADGC